MYGKFNILGQEVEVPAAVFLKYPPAEEKARAGDGAARSEEHSRVVEVAGFPQKPKGVPGGDPVVPEVLGAAVAGDGVVAPTAEGLVHLRREVLVHHVVGVEDEVARVVPAGVEGQELLERIDEYTSQIGNF